MKLTPVERDILQDMFYNGDDVASNIGRRTERHRVSVSRRFPGLEEKGLVRHKGSGVYTLTIAGYGVARELIDETDK